MYASRVRARIRKALGDGLWGFLGAALSADEKSRLGVRRYGASGEYRDAPRYEWEDAWLGRWLPAAPARVFVGAAGAGREAASLVARGYAVTALEPSRELAALCRSRVPAARVVIGRYEDLAGGAAARSGEGPFDVVLMGLGSLSHLLDGEQRAAVMRALASLCPAGPILASAVAPPRSGMWSPGRAARLGRALAMPVRALRRLPALDPGEVAFGGLGFVKLFGREELRAIGDAMGRRAVFEEDRPDGMELCAWPVK